MFQFLIIVAIKKNKTCNQKLKELHIYLEFHLQVDNSGFQMSWSKNEHATCDVKKIIKSQGSALSALIEL